MAARPTTAGTSMAVAAMCCVQLGVAVSVELADRIGAIEVAWLRLLCAGLILLVAVRPWRATFTLSALRTCVALGATTVGAAPAAIPRRGRRRPPLFGLAPGGVCRAAPVAGGAVRSCRTLSPLPAGGGSRRARAVCSLWHFP